MDWIVVVIFNIIAFPIFFWLGYRNNPDHQEAKTNLDNMMMYRRLWSDECKIADSKTSIIGILQSEIAKVRNQNAILEAERVHLDAAIVSRYRPISPDCEKHGCQRDPSR